MHKQKSRKCKRYIRKRIKKALEEVKNTEYKIDWSKSEEKRKELTLNRLCELSRQGIIEGLKIEKTEIITEEKIREDVNRK